jgi:ATP-binding cassette subfamily B multidrug efflux pump
MRLLDPTSGKIMIDEHDLKYENIDAWRKKIGYVPQEHFLFSDTIKNNILFGLDREYSEEKLSPEIEEQLIKVSKDAGIHDTIMGFPNGYDTVLGERGINLSGGQKQRVSIARALMKNPEILVLDDCLSAVDNETEEQILQALKTGLASKTAIIISHRISSIKYADSILVVEDGKVVEEGTHEDLLKRNGAYTDIYSQQQLQQDQE